jgi:hypothetical protein
VERPYDRRNAGRKPEQELGFGPERVEKMLFGFRQNTGRQTQAFERNRRAEAAMVRAVHGAEAALGHDGFDMIRRSDHGPDDAERVFCHL